MIYVRSSILLSLAVIPLVMSAIDNESGSNRWFGTPAHRHYVKQFVYGAVQGAVLGFGVQAAQDAQLIPKIPVEVDNVVTIVGTAVSSQCICAQKNGDGIYKADPVIAWMAHLAGYLACREVVVTNVQAFVHHILW